MKRWTMYALAISLMLVSQQAMAQFNAFLVHAAPAGPLVTICGGATPLPEGTPIKIFLDVDSDGPDLDDPQPTVCIDPPDCVTPFDAVNFNEFTINGVFHGIGGGNFFTDPAFTCASAIPGTGRFYLRIYEPDNTTILYTSTVFTVQPGLQEVYFTDEDWTCGSAGPQCTVIDETE